MSETTEAPPGDTAWRHPKRGKAHRIVGSTNPRIACNALGVPFEYRSVPLSDVDSKDRCRLCWRAR